MWDSFGTNLVLVLSNFWSWFWFQNGSTTDAKTGPKTESKNGPKTDAAGEGLRIQRPNRTSISFTKIEGEGISFLAGKRSFVQATWFLREQAKRAVRIIDKAIIQMAGQARNRVLQKKREEQETEQLIVAELTILVDRPARFGAPPLTGWFNARPLAPFRIRPGTKVKISGPF